MHLRDTGLADLLRVHGVERITLLGLATDYCVKFSALDAVEQGFDVTVVRDGCRAVELEPGDGDRALAEMAEAGCAIVESADHRRGIHVWRVDDSKMMPKAPAKKTPAARFSDANP